MKNFVRGGIILTIVSLCVAIIYAQTNAAKILSSANDSQQKFNNTEIDSTLNKTEITENNIQVQDQDQKQKNEKVAKTVSSRVTGGASKGSFTATAYCLKGRTAMGHGVRRGLIAADPRVLRLGSRINLGAGAYSGQYLVSDTGGAVRGRRIDIWMPSCAEARRFGRRTVNISVL
jgi:3D (Asp-Asp-Asp) domain-containing protein